MSTARQINQLPSKGVFPLSSKELRIKRVMKERGRSQAKTARLADVAESSMSRIVRGLEPPYPNRGQRIADALSWEGDWRELFEEVEEAE